MIRNVVLGLAAVLPAIAGCASDGNEGSLRTLFTDPGSFSFKKAVGWEEVKTPRDLKLPQSDPAIVERVELLGKRIIAQNAFTGIEPLFNTAGVSESVLFHIGTEQLIISEGLVKQCKTEAELAAVLCSELGQMVAEKRAVRRVGAERDSFPESALPGGASVGGGTPFDAGHAAELGYRDRLPKPPPTIDPANSEKLARDLLKGAGFDPASLDNVKPLLKLSDRSGALRKQMSPSAPAPTWNN
jgi:hypothetical protein